MGRITLTEYIGESEARTSQLSVRRRARDVAEDPIEWPRTSMGAISGTWGSNCRESSTNRTRFARRGGEATKPKFLVANTKAGRPQCGKDL